jgi:hypothetical protein
MTLSFNPNTKLYFFVLILVWFSPGTSHSATGAHTVFIMNMLTFQRKYLVSIYLTYVTTFRYPTLWRIALDIPVAAQSKKSAHLLWHPKVYHRIHKTLTLAPILSHGNPPPMFTFFVFKINFNITLRILVRFSSGLFPSGFPVRMSYAFSSLQYVLHALPSSSSSSALPNDPLW